MLLLFASLEAVLPLSTGGAEWAAACVAPAVHLQIELTRPLAEAEWTASLTNYSTESCR